MQGSVYNTIESDELVPKLTAGADLLFLRCYPPFSFNLKMIYQAEREMSNILMYFPYGQNKLLGDEAPQSKIFSTATNA